MVGKLLTNHQKENDIILKSLAYMKDLKRNARTSVEVPKRNCERNRLCNAALFIEVKANGVKAKRAQKLCHATQFVLEIT